MFTSNERGIQKQAQVDFTRSGWRQFIRLNRSLGARFLRGFVFQYELAAYLTAHEAAGVELDEGCQEVCYEEGVYLLLRKMQGVWYIQTFSPRKKPLTMNLFSSGGKFGAAPTLSWHTF